MGEKLLQEIGVVSYDVVFTTGLDENKRPVDDISEISMTESNVHIFIKWKFEITKNKYPLIGYEIFDGAGNMVTSSTSMNRPMNNFWNSWRDVVFDKYLHKPGKWKFNVRLNGQNVIEKYLIVFSE